MRPQPVVAVPPSRSEIFWLYPATLSSAASATRVTSSASRHDSGRKVLRRSVHQVVTPVCGDSQLKPIKLSGLPCRLCCGLNVSRSGGVNPAKHPRACCPGHCRDITGQADKRLLGEPGEGPRFHPLWIDTDGLGGGYFNMLEALVESLQ